MVVEAVFIEVAPDAHEAFESAVRRAVEDVMSRAHGFLGMSMLSGIERRDVYALAIQWETIEDHTEGFRGSALFDEWRAIVSPFFVGAPSVDHWAPVLTIEGP